MRFRFVVLFGLAFAMLAAGASLGRASAPAFQTVRLPSSNGFSEPREAIDNTGNFWIESNAADSSAAVWGSKDGLRWTQTPSVGPFRRLTIGTITESSPAFCMVRLTNTPKP